MKILDLSAGNRAVWFDKNRNDCIYLDRRLSVKPTICGNSTMLPFRDGIFDLVVFDPPHVNAGQKSNISLSYGWHTTVEIRNLISETAREAHRVTQVNGLMAFKWNDHDQRLGPVLALMSDFWEALCGHTVAKKMKRRSETFWALLRRRAAEGSGEVLPRLHQSAGSIDVPCPVPSAELIMSQSFGNATRI